jgi:hypothetical protein
MKMLPFMRVWINNEESAKYKCIFQRNDEVLKSNILARKSEEGTLP